MGDILKFGTPLIIGAIVLVVLLVIVGAWIACIWAR